MMTHTPKRPHPPESGFRTPHLLTVSGLSDVELTYLLELALYYHLCDAQGVPPASVLAGVTQVNLFLEASTRTNISFEIAGKRLGADVVVVPVSGSSKNKDESDLDTALTLASMQAGLLIIRAKITDTARHVAAGLEAAGLACRVVNGGEGHQSHPTQALLDAVTLLAHFGRSVKDGLHGLTLAVCGDITHSRVARSTITVLLRLGANIRLIAPTPFLPKDAPYAQLPQYTNLGEGLTGCDVVMALRVQKERMDNAIDFDNARYFADYGLTHARLQWARPGAKIMHPGPINRQVEIDGTLADDRGCSLILDQVACGVTTRMAVLDAFGTPRQVI